METALLQTKLYIPSTRPRLVSRPRLIERLNAGRYRKLTLISAPVGFGKTTLVSEWIHSGVRSKDYGVGERHEAEQEAFLTSYSLLPTPRFAWISLDESDNDVTRFLTYFIAALQTLEADMGKGMLNALQSPQPPSPEVVLTTLINEVAAISDPVIFVLDDYHLIEAQPIHDVLTFLLRHLPSNMHLVIATREDPILPLARLRARGQLTELRAGDLRFTASEAAEFLNQVMGLRLSEQDITALESRTEGWIAGLQLAALSMQGSKDAKSFIESFTGSHRYVLDYLIEEVLEQQPEDIQAFLLQTSVLNRLTASLCDALTGQDNGQATLEMLERANLFIVPLDNERRWYRYHHLFADLLRQRLRQTQQELESKLHIQASVWYEQNGLTDYAIEHALHANHYERATQLIEEHVDTMWGSGIHSNLQRWLVGLPDEWLCFRPQLCIYRAWFMFSTGQEEAAERVLQVAEQRLDPKRTIEGSGPEQEPLSAAARTKLCGRLDAIRAVMDFWRKDMPEVIRHASQALEALSADDPWRGMAVIALGDAYYFQGDMQTAYQIRLEVLESSKPVGDLFSFMIANLKVATSLRALGRLHQTIEICQQQVQFAKENGLSHTIFVGWAMALWAISLAETNELDQALELTTKSVELTKGGDLAFSGFSNIVLAQVRFYRGDFAGAESVLQELENIAQKYYLPFHIMESVAAWKARIWLARNQLEIASRWIKESGLDVDGEPASPLNRVSVALARVFLAQGNLEKAISLLARLFEAAEAGGHAARMIEILALQTLASQAKKNATQAMYVLEQAITLAEPGGYIRVFVDEGPPMAHLLYEALSRGIAPDYVRRLLAAFPTAEPEPVAVSPAPEANAGLIEPLSERELEVLHLIAEGLTNREIATRLYLSLNTVKVHTRNIYGKLGVSNRTQAATQARALGILHFS
jgi:LuxR family maltose regulon positive regulatory protein